MRSFRLVDSRGHYVSCVALGYNAEDAALDNDVDLLVLFATAKPGLGGKQCSGFRAVRKLMVLGGEFRTRGEALALRSVLRACARPCVARCDRTDGGGSRRGCSQVSAATMQTMQAHR